MALQEKDLHKIIANHMDFMPYAANMPAKYFFIQIGDLLNEKGDLPASDKEKLAAEFGPWMGALNLKLMQAAARREAQRRKNEDSGNWIQTCLLLTVPDGVQRADWLKYVVKHKPGGVQLKMLLQEQGIKPKFMSNAIIKSLESQRVYYKLLGTGNESNAVPEGLTDHGKEVYTIAMDLRADLNEMLSFLFARINAVFGKKIHAGEITEEQLYRFLGKKYPRLFSRKVISNAVDFGANTEKYKFTYMQSVFGIYMPSLFADITYDHICAIQEDKDVNYHWLYAALVIVKRLKPEELEAYVNKGTHAEWEALVLNSPKMTMLMRHWGYPVKLITFRKTAFYDAPARKLLHLYYKNK